MNAAISSSIIAGLSRAISRCSSSIRPRSTPIPFSGRCRLPSSRSSLVASVVVTPISMSTSLSFRTGFVM